MQSRIVGSTMPVLELLLEPGESVISEAGELSWMSQSIGMTTHTQFGGGGGFFGAIKRMAGGGTLFMTEYGAQGYAGEVAFATKIPGHILPVEVSPGHEYMIHRHGFVCGLALGKWIHNGSGLAMLAVFGLLILSPVWAWAHGVHLHYAPLAFHLPSRDKTSLSLLGQTLFAASGLEYIAIMAGETHAANRDIGRSVIVASPIIFLMFVLGTASVLSFHELHAGVPINYIAPIPQTLSFAFGGSGAVSSVARLAILLLQIRILGAASFIFTGVVRLPMAAGWDHLVPAWFARLDPRFDTPVNSITLTTIAVAALLLLGSAGVHAAEAFAVLNDTSSELYALAYLSLFLIPLAGSRSVRDRLPRWIAPVCFVGVLTILFVLVFNAYPFLDVPSPGVFAAKIVGMTMLLNGLGYAFYRMRSRPAWPSR